MKWQEISLIKPPLEKKVLVWRSQREKYTIASLELLNIENQDVFFWITEHGSVHKVLPEDQWMEFPYLIKEKVYGPAKTKEKL